MSSGSILDDKRKSMSLGCGVAMTGTYFKKVWTGASTPRGQKFKDLPYALSLVSANEPVIDWKIGPNGFAYQGTVSSCFGGPSGDAKKEWTSADDLVLLGKLVKAVRTHEFNAAVSLAEGFKTLDMIADTATTIAKAFLAVKKGDMVGAARHLKVKPSRRYGSTKKDDVASRWLGLQYGWIPVLADAKNAAEAFALSMNRPIRSSVRVSHTRRQDGLTATTAGVVFDLHKVRRKNIIYRFEEDYAMYASLGMLDPESVAWELMPFSFVWDWFQPIGTFLETRAHVRRFKGTFVESDLDYSRWQYSSSGPRYVIKNAELASARSVTFTRKVSNSPPSVPFPKFKPLNEAFSWKRAANALALVQVVFNQGDRTGTRR